ncbi:MAG: hypothetical protein AAF581_03710 [Planctomycetota bacterium]
MRWPPEPQPLELRLNALASRSDWQTAFSVLRRAISLAGGSVELDGEPLSLEQLVDEEAVRRGTDDFLFSCQALRQGGTTHFGSFSVEISAALLAGCTLQTLDSVEQELADLIEPFASAMAPAIARLATGSSYCYWMLGPTLIDKNCEFVEVCVGEGPANTYIKLDELIQILGARVGDAGPSFYLPRIDCDKETHLLERLLMAGKKHAEMAEAERLAPDRSYLSTPEGVALVAKYIVQAVMFIGDSPEDVVARLTNGGLDPALVETLLQGTLIALDAVQRTQEPAEIMEVMKKKTGATDALAAQIWTGVLEGL